MQVVEPVPSSSSTPTHASFLSRKYFSSLDVFRFLAIMAVLWHHTAKGPEWLPMANRGFLGVDLFFVISGFLIVTLLLRERDRTGGISLRQFYLRRSLRIFPIYYGLLGAIAAFFLFIKPRSPSAGLFFADLPYQMLYLSNVAGGSWLLFFTWSLATEEQFYLIWPPVEKWLKGYAVPVLLAVIALNMAVGFGLLDGVVGPGLKAREIGQITFTPICLGVLLAHLLHDGRWFARVAPWLGRSWSSAAAAGLVLLTLNIPRGDLTGWPRLLIQASMALLLASCVIREDNWLVRLLGFRPIRRIGVISYGMYLYHEFVYYVVLTRIVGESTTRPLSHFAWTTALTVLVAELSFRFYETPFLKLKDRLHAASARRKAEGA